MQTENDKLKVSSEGQTKFTGKWIQICAWILFTVGLCILITTFYLAIHHHDNGETADMESIGDSLQELELDDKPATSSPPDTETGFDLQVNRSARSHELELEREEQNSNSRRPIAEQDGMHGCEENLCKVTCTQAVDLFTSVYRTMAFSDCPASDLLLIQKQDFPMGVLNNSWIYLNHAVHEVALMHSNLTRIRNAAFNSPLFTNTFLLAINKLKNDLKLDSGALLGLRSLKYLLIDTRMTGLDRALFQPVQTTLTYLKVSARLNIAADQQFAGISEMQALQTLDLSFNTFDGSLTKNLFSGMNNLKQLIITHANVNAIEADAFSELAGKLFALNLSYNSLRIIPSEALAPLLEGNGRFQISMAINNWYCNCKIQPLSLLYTQYRSQFMEPIFCRAPHFNYGTFIDDISIQHLICTDDSITEDYENKNTTTTITTEPPRASIPGVIESEEISSESDEDSGVFRLRCLSALNGLSYVAAETKTAIHAAQEQLERILPVEVTTSTLAATKERTLNLDILHDSLDFELLQFERPSYTFELELLANKSVLVYINDYSETSTEVNINVIWFSDAIESYNFSYANTTIDYSCSGYDTPNLLVDTLEENTTYTFCMIPRDNYTITPFNCLPMHVPHSMDNDDHVWISQEEKRFTIGMLCLFCLISSLFGAVIAYFGIKTHPDLLEGSKNVLVVKKSDRTCYVSTIGDANCLKEKPPLSHANSLKYATTNAKNDNMPTDQAPPPPSPIAVNVKNLERLASMKSSSTCFEEPPFIIPILTAEDEYELPKTFDPLYRGGERCVQNPYATSPCSPPPLPKRNSVVSESTTIVPNRFSALN